MTKMFHELQGIVAGHLSFPVAVFAQADQWSTAHRPAVDQLSAAAWLLIRNMTAVRSARGVGFTKELGVAGFVGLPSRGNYAAHR
ncbi:MAG TPA: hypothetical protein VK620_02375 [Bradyrhizobium sp.]|nr:hypothetical protein [Bradyrhizobium sp.]